VTFDLGPALLFCPADRPDRFDKAAERADAVILDLEDAVATGDKAAAREALVAHPLDPATTIVRVNAVDSGYFDDDLAALARTGYRRVMLAKAETAVQVHRLDGFEVIALCETAAGIVSVASIAAAPSVVALMWGAEDLVASLGGTSSRDGDGRYRAVAVHARSSMLLAEQRAKPQSTRYTSISPTCPVWNGRRGTPGRAVSRPPRASIRARCRRSGPPISRHRRKSPPLPRCSRRPRGSVVSSASMDAWSMSPSCDTRERSWRAGLHSLSGRRRSRPGSRRGRRRQPGRRG
jgi:hypothetical protein